MDTQDIKGHIAELRGLLKFRSGKGEKELLAEIAEMEIVLLEAQAADPFQGFFGYIEDGDEPCEHTAEEEGCAERTGSFDDRFFDDDLPY